MEWKKPSGDCSVVTQDTRVLEALQRIRCLMESNSSLCVTIYGESGTGKEEIAKFASRIRGGPLVAINMAALSGSIAESELFGHTKGSFTGALSDKEGLFRAAKNGVLFLDEIGDCPLDLQLKLFRVLQEREVIPVGSHRSYPLQAKILVATNQDLRKLVAQGKFRSELLYRIEGMTVSLPSLRERPGDIPILVERFLRDLSPKDRNIQMTPQALATLTHNKWLGNIRELRNVVERSILNVTGDVIDIEHLPADILTEHAAQPPPCETTSLLDAAIRRVRADAYVEALRKANGSRTRACKLLGLGRATFYRHMKELGLLGRM